MSEASERQGRAQARRQRAILRRTRLERVEPDIAPVSGPEALTLATRLTLESWAAAGLEVPSYSRAATPYRFARRGGA